MKKILLFLLIILLPISMYSFSLFPDYDFVYFNTLSFDDNTNINYLFNKTAYGFINDYDTNGIYLKLGYGSNKKIYNLKENEGSYIIEVLPEDETKDLDLIHNIDVLLGPAVRHQISNFANIYLGLGLQINHVMEYRSNAYTNNTSDYTTRFSIDLDFGYNFLLIENTSIIFGINNNLKMIDFNHKVNLQEDEIQQSTQVNMHFLVENNRFYPNLYLSVAKVFTNEDYTNYYKYTIDSPKKFTGTIEYL